MSAPNIGQCEVCKQEPAVGVACVPGIPYSAAYGRNCLQQGADPYEIVRANIACCNGPEHVANWVLDRTIFLDGEYMAMREALTRYPMTQEEINL
jgi:hypothetical protein